MSAWRVWGVSSEGQILPPMLITLTHAWGLGQVLAITEKVHMSS